MMLASIVLPRPTSSARMARPLMWRSTRWATSIWCGSALIAFASSVISRSKPGTRAIRSASRRSSCQARSVGGAWSRFANASRECLSTDQTSSAGGVGRGRTVGDSGIDTQRVARGPQYTSYQLALLPAARAPQFLALISAQVPAEVEQPIQDIVGLEVGLAAVEVHEPSRNEAPLLVENEPDAPASARDGLAAAAAFRLRARRALGAVDPREAPVRQARARRALKALSTGHVRRRFHQGLEQRLRPLV